MRFCFDVEKSKIFCADTFGFSGDRKDERKKLCKSFLV
jgi:hypothetical protein